MNTIDKAKLLGMASDVFTIGGFLGLGVAAALGAGWVGILGYLSLCALVAGLAIAQQLKK